MEVASPSVLMEQRLLKIQIQKSLRGRRACTETLIGKKRNIPSEKRGSRHGTNYTQKFHKTAASPCTDTKEAPGSPASNSSSTLSFDFEETRL